MYNDKDNVINAKEGFILTNGEVYANSVQLGKYDKEENWYEITLDEYEDILFKEQEKV